MALNDGYEYTERLGPDADGVELLDHLCRRYAHSSREEWAGRIAADRVLLDGRTARAGETLFRGRVLSWRRPPWDEPDAASAFEILYDDEDLLAVSKPAGLPTLPGAGFLERTLLRGVRAIAPGAAPLHRLGRWTSGVVLFARTPRARADLTRQWAAREIGKRYRALASGSPASDAFTVTAPIGRVPHALLGSVHAVADGGKPALSEVAVLERRDGAFLCDVRIVTGRPHQIRVHLAAAGHPLVGDPLYVAGGGIAAGSRAVPGDPGYLLHAAELTFRHPRDGRSITVRCEAPDALRPRVG